MAATAGESDWWNAWAKLKAILVQLDQSVLKLEASRAYALARPNLRAEYLEKMADVQSMRAKAVWLRDAIRAAADALGVQLSGLGLAPALLLWPAVIGGVAWLGSKALDLWTFAQRVDEQRRLEAQGMSPQSAAALVNQKAEAGTFADAIKTVVPVVVIGGIAWWWFTQRRGQSGKA